MFLVAQDSSDSQLQAYASWAIAFLHQHLCSKVHRDEIASSMPIDQNFSKDAAILKLSTWMMQLDYSRVGHLMQLFALFPGLGGLVHIF